MGDYTGLRFKGIVKEDYRKDFEDIALYGEWEASKFELFKNFGKIPRASLIPAGDTCYVKKQGWFEDNNGFERRYVKETGYWVFETSLKNYEATIEQFINIVWLFCESVDVLESKYEYDRYTTNYTFTDIENGVCTVTKIFEDESLNNDKHKEILTFCKQKVVFNTNENKYNS